jgi:hypothetical protein
MADHFTGTRRRHESCTDPVVGAILSGWRYDISEIAPELRGDYEEHLGSCVHCRGRQRRHRTVDVLLLLAFTLTFGAFLLMAVIVHRYHALNHLTALHLLPENTAMRTHIPASIFISMETLAIGGVVVSMLLWVLVAIATPVPRMVVEFRQKLTGGRSDRLRKQAA